MPNLATDRRNAVSLSAVESKSDRRPSEGWIRGPRKRVEDILRLADVTIDGDRPWDLQVHDDRLFTRVLLEGSLGLGESYMDGWWDTPRLDELCHRLLTSEIDTRVRPWTAFLHGLSARIFNLQTPRRALEVGRRHYDIGNDLYAGMLDSRMIYSCGYWRDAATLDEAQAAKLDLVFEKLQLKPGMRVLDIGCGWGGAAKYAAENYGVSVVGITISEQQFQAAEALCKDLDVEILFEDYRNLQGRFDRIFSIGMFEHVGVKNYARFFDVVRRLLTEDGLFLLHTIGGIRSVSGTDPWINRYIFPNSMLPASAQITDAMEGRFILEDWHAFGPDYDLTLMAWYDNFVAAWPTLEHNYDERFFRMWEFYLLSCAGSFRARKNQVWQILLSPHGLTPAEPARFRSECRLHQGQHHAGSGTRCSRSRLCTPGQAGSRKSGGALEDRGESGVDPGRRNASSRHAHSVCGPRGLTGVRIRGPRAFHRGSG
jgi:cyclopropane-fatty-acyl-phospholipid synthase